MAHVWEWFAALDRRRTNGGLGANPLQPSEVQAWFRQMGLAPTPWELDLIYRLDEAILAKVNKPAEGQDEPHRLISTKDTAGVKYIFAKLEARQKRRRSSPGDGQPG